MVEIQGRMEKNIHSAVHAISRKTKTTSYAMHFLNISPGIFHVLVKFVNHLTPNPLLT